LTAILPNITNLSKALVVGKKIFDVVERVSEIGENSDEDKTENKMISLKQGIEFKGVHFRYPTAPEGLQDTLQGVSFEIKAGTSTAIVGASGSGKSTIVQMIERFYDPRKGEIFLDGKNIKECSLS
jgi:ATP-binding cassette, subfamily B (MDR/TAP), member 1